MKNFLLYILLLITLPFLLLAEARSYVYHKKTPIMIVNIDSENQDVINITTKVNAFIENNIQSISSFELLKSFKKILFTGDTGLIPDFDKWEELGVKLLVNYKANISNEKIYVEVYIWNIRNKSQLSSKLFSSSIKDWEEIANAISDEIYKVGTGNKPYFNSYIGYIEEENSDLEFSRKLNIVKYKSSDVKVIETESSLNMMPSFCSKNKSLAYVSYREGFAKIYTINLNNGEKQALNNINDFSIAPSCSEDGKMVLFSSSKDDNIDIFSMDMKSRLIKRLTKHTAIDVSASYSSDGNKIVFTSDRSGREQIYVMRKDGSDIKRISFGEETASYSSPTWSPLGKKIAFIKNIDDQQQLGIMDSNGNNEVILTNKNLDNDPVFISEDRILFYREIKKRGIIDSSKIYIINIVTKAESLFVNTGGKFSEPVMIYTK